MMKIDSERYAFMATKSTKLLGSYLLPVLAKLNTAEITNITGIKPSPRALKAFTIERLGEGLRKFGDEELGHTNVISKPVRAATMPPVVPQRTVAQKPSSTT